MTSQQYWAWAHRVGLLFVLATVACFLWTWAAITDGGLLKLYDQLMQLSVLGWTGFNTVSIVLALIQAYIWGYVGVGLWAITLRLASEKR